jgi:predicted dehydrogenase
MGINRRQFLERTLGGGAGVALGAAHAGLAPTTKAVPASDKVVVGMMGVGDRGTFLTQLFASRRDVYVAYICDVDTRKFARAVKVVADLQAGKPKVVGNFERILEDRGVDALVCATPDHWHALATVLACQAGKDVYVEKPPSHDIWEGRKMVEAARKYRRVVQVGLQNRSSSYARSARELIESRKLGGIHLARVFNMVSRQPVEDTPDSPAPAGLDWDMWLGPAALRPYNPKWLKRAFWDLNGGNITDDGIHQLDLARMVLGVSYPRSVHHSGGKLSFRDIAEVPDTMLVTYEYDGLTLVFEETWWTPYMKKIPESVRENKDVFPDWFPFIGTRIELYGDQGLMLLGRHGGGWQIFDVDGQKIATDKQKHSEMQAAHVDNFVSCIRTREKSHADIEEGHTSATLCHIANISYRLGNRTLHFDPATERFDDKDANQYLRRSYRAPWVMPEKV